MLSKATSSVSSMLETVETQLGIPSPTEMANLAAKSKSNPDNQATNVLLSLYFIHILFFRFSKHKLKA